LRKCEVHEFFSNFAMDMRISRNILLYCPVSLVLAASVSSCSCSGGSSCTDSDSAVVDAGPVYHKLKLSPKVGNLARQFNDMQKDHLKYAERLGISPIETLNDAWQVSRPLEKIESGDDFEVDELTHSHPYLVPEAASLLHDVGRRFNDSLMARGGGNYRIKVTSALRTLESVNRLKKRNINSLNRSAHLFGTTFDVSYVKFPCDSITVARTDGDLKNLLAEILLDLRSEGRCLVKYERKQGCFHITATR